MGDDTWREIFRAQQVQNERGWGIVKRMAVKALGVLCAAVAVLYALFLGLFALIATIGALAHLGRVFGL
jgi:hypothetical protein